jgi:O-antigen ligase
MVLLTSYVKYAVLIALIYVCVDTPENLKLVLWSHVAGCAYLGWIVLSQYTGGRFEGFGGPDIDEANSGAMQIVTGIVSAGALFLTGTWKARAVVIAVAPMIVNALVATVSRSGFLAAAVAGIAFNVFTAPKYRRFVKVASVLAIVLFVALTNPHYWERMASIKVAGEDIEGVDTGAGRKELLIAQWDMFKKHPLGCGHRCTATLSTNYLDDSLLTGIGENRARSSHNTFMSLLVEQGLPGAALYILLAMWVFKSTLELRRRLRVDSGILSQSCAAVAAALAAIFVGDLFVDYLKLEVRTWLLALLMALIKLSHQPDGPWGRQKSAGRPGPKGTEGS